MMRLARHGWFVVLGDVALAAFHAAPSAQVQQPAALVSEGGTLIDGNGGDRS